MKKGMYISNPIIYCIIRIKILISSSLFNKKKMKKLKHERLPIRKKDKNNYKIKKLRKVEKKYKFCYLYKYREILILMLC